MAETVSGKKIVLKNPVQFDVGQTKPPFLDEGSYRDVNENVSGLNLDETEVTVDDQNTQSMVLETPTIESVLSETIRMSEGGGAVVDVVLSVSDSIGAQNYEVRLSKI